MVQLNTNPRYDTALRALLVRLHPEDVSKYLSYECGTGDSSPEEVEKYTRVVMGLSQKDYSTLSDEAYIAIKRYLCRLDLATAKKIYAREWAGEMLSDDQIEDLYGALVLFYYNEVREAVKNI